MSSATPTVAARAIAVPARTASASTLRATNRRERAGFGSFAKLVAIGFWGTLATLIVSAAAVPGFAVFALLPLLGMPYLVFCLIAVTGDRNVE